MQSLDAYLKGNVSHIHYKDKWITTDEGNNMILYFKWYKEYKMHTFL
jgi:hypothetical protein